MEKIFQRLASEELTPNQYFVMWSIREGISPTGVNIHLEMRGLIPDWVSDGRLTGKALSLLIELDELFPVKKTANDADLMGKDFKKKIEEYRLIFPDRKLKSGQYARSNVKNLETNFRWFFKNYSYDWETILKATIKYESEWASKDYEFMRTSMYFIKKQDQSKTITSTLADYCEMVVTGEGETDSGPAHFPEKVV